MDDDAKEDPIPSPSHPLQNASEDIRGPDSEANAQMGSQQDHDDDIQDHGLEKESKNKNEHVVHGSDGKLEAKSEVDALAK